MKQLENYQLWRLVLIGMLFPLALIAFWPSPVDQPVQGQLAAILKFLHSHGLPRWINYKSIEASANVALFIPIGIISKLAFATRRWWQVGIFGLLISCSVELGQLLFLHNRFPSWLDLMTNLSGAVIGALLAALALKKLGARRLPATDP